VVLFRADSGFFSAFVRYFVKTPGSFSGPQCFAMSSFLQPFFAPFSIRNESTWDSAFSRGVEGVRTFVFPVVISFFPDAPFVSSGLIVLFFFLWPFVGSLIAFFNTGASLDMNFLLIAPCSNG